MMLLVVLMLSSALVAEALASKPAAMPRRELADGLTRRDGLGKVGGVLESLRPLPTRSAAGRERVLQQQATGSIRTVVVSWGLDGNGQATVPPNLLNATTIVGGQNNSAAIQDGKLTIWGDGGTGLTSVPPGNFSAVALGQDHVVALLTDGTVQAWGMSDSGQVNVPAGLADVVSVAARGNHSLALLRDGTVVGWGSNLNGEITIPSNLGKVTAIAAGSDHTLALLANGSVAAWGSNAAGQRDVPPAALNVTAISAGSSFSAALLANGAVLVWGDNSYYQTEVPLEAMANVTAVSAGGQFVVALKNDGTLVIWGRNDDAECSPPAAAVYNVQKIAAGTWHVLALVEDSPPSPLAPSPPGEGQSLKPLEVVAWGFDGSGQVSGLPQMTNVTYIASGASNSAAIADGELFVWGWSGLTDVPPRPPGVNYSAVSIGEYHILVLYTDGTVNAWGWNDEKQTAIPNRLKDAVAVAASGNHSLALQSDGTVVAWGGNANNQSTVPPGLNNVTAIAAGDHHSMALCGNGSVVAWGLSTDGQVDVPVAALSGIIAIDAGGRHSLALHSNGTVIAWGASNKGQSTVPERALGNVTAVAAGGQWSMVLLNDGTPIAWGLNADRQSSIPLKARSGVVSMAAGGWHGLALVRPSAAPPIISIPPVSPAPPSPPPYSPSPLQLSPLPPSPLPPPSPPPPSPIALMQPPPPSPLSAKSPSSSAKVGVIVGAAVGGITAVAALALLSWWLVRRHKRSTHPPGTGGNLPGPSESLFVEVKEMTSGRRTGAGMGKPIGLSGRTTESIDETIAHQTVMLRNIKILWESIAIGPILGQGGFGNVRKGTWQGNAVAVKMLNLQNLSAGAQDELRRETLAMCNLRHPRIAQVFGLVDDGVHTALVMRYYKRGTVAAVVQDPDYYNFDMGQRLRMALQIASGMCFLHSRQLLHGDLKTSNLLVEDTGHGVVLADFGLSSVAGQAVASGALTVSISPPEVLQDPTAPRTQAGDVYAFAMVLLEVVDGRVPYKSMKSHQVKDCVCRGLRPTIPDDVPPGVAAIISACWAQEASSRPTFEAIMKVLETEAAGGALDQENRHPHHGGQNTTTTRPTFTLTDLTASRF